MSLSERSNWCPNVTLACLVSHNTSTHIQKTFGLADSKEWTSAITLPRLVLIRRKTEGKHIMKSLNTLNCVKWLHVNIFKYNTKELSRFLSAFQNTSAVPLNRLIKRCSEAQRHRASSSEDYGAPHIALSGNIIWFCIFCIYSPQMVQKTKRFGYVSAAKGLFDYRTGTLKAVEQKVKCTHSWSWNICSIRLTLFPKSPLRNSEFPKARCVNRWTANNEVKWHSEWVHTEKILFKHQRRRIIIT